MTRILVVDDEPRYVRTIVFNLELSGYETISAYDGATALELARDAAPNLILLDLRLPDVHGFEVCQRIREFSQVPIIMLTALSEVQDRVRGLNIGADDYVCKPFSAQELIERVRAVLRRATPPDASIYQSGELTVDWRDQRVSMGGQQIDLTPTEYHVLIELVRRAGRVVQAPELLQSVWSRDYAGDTYLVHQAIHRLRQKIERDPQSPEYIITMPDGGYSLSPPL
jgi:DNA-binding response OmpR family regulator